jgi:chromatin remodeling complex protein RSC6
MTTCKTKSCTKKSSKKGAFGGYTISFKGESATLETVFGVKPLPPSEMTKKLWAYVKRHNLSNN